MTKQTNNQTQVNPMTESKHSPLPWRMLDHHKHFRDGTQAYDIQSYADDGLGDFVAVKVREPDAELIERAVNCHDELVAA